MQEEKEPEKAQEKEGVDQVAEVNENQKVVEQEEDKEELNAGIGGRPAKKG